MALYPLPAVYFPGSQCMVRNIEPRNIAMCRECPEFVAACVTSPGFSSCASVGAVLRIDDVRAASRDTSGKVLAAAAESNVLEVRCTVVGRVRLVACENLECWRGPQRDEYLVADVEEYEDEEVEAADEEGVPATEARECLDEEWWMGASAAGDAADAIYRLVDELIASTSGAGDGADESSMDVDAAVASLERAAELAEDGDVWGALDLWQVHCATRLASMAALQLTERNEFLIDAKLRQGGALQIPVREWTLEPEDRAKLLDLDARAADAVSQMGLDDASAFQACLEARQESERAELLQRGVQREAERLARRAAVRRALDASS